MSSEWPVSKQTNAKPTVERLIDELGVGEATRADPAAQSEIVFERTFETIFDEQPSDIDDGLVKQSLPELLVMLVALRTSDTHGKGIMEDLNRFFGVQLSPGTVYPTLHDLADEGLLEMRELVQTKEYTIDDEESVRQALEGAMAQHLALGLLFQQTLDEIDTAEQP
jgi:hypothetical protein